MRERRSRVGFGAAVAVIALLLAGCANIPTGGGVNSGPTVRTEPGASFADVPTKPSKNASPSEILSDFMQNASLSDNNYAASRLFLTPQAAQSWVPTKSVLIREGQPQVQTEVSGTILYSVTTKASVDDQGIYQEQATTSTAPLSFSFAKVHGQWRISSLADGIVISRNNFERFFAPHPLYFFDPSFKFLVPDVRWFPTGGTVESRIVSALLGGPSVTLQGGVVVTAFPPGTQQLQSVIVRGVTATVNLSAGIGGLSATVKGELLKQLEKSLSSTSVTEVSVQVRGAPVTIPHASSAVEASSVESAPLVLRNKKFGFSARLTPIAGLSAAIAALSPTGVTVGRSQSDAAVRAKNGVSLVTDDGDAPVLVDSRSHLLTPSIDQYGYVWSVPSTDASAIRVSSSSGKTYSVTSSLPRGASAVSMAVSNDGTRVLMYLRTSAGPRLIIAGVIRRDGRPTGLGPLLDLPVSSDAPVDATWVDSESVAALAGPAASQNVVVYTIGGSGGDASTIANAVHIVGGSGEGTLRLITSTGQIQQLHPTGWQAIELSASVLATQQ